MGFMTKFERVAEKALVPIASKLNSQRHVIAIRDAFILSFPITLAGSLVLLLNFAILAPDGFIAKILFLHKLFPNLADLQSVFSPVINGSVNILSMFIVFLVARNLAISMKADELLCGLTGLSAFFIIYPPYKVVDGGSFLTTQWVGAQGLFVALIVGLIVGELFSRLTKYKKLQFNMHPSVPPAVSRSFKVLFPIIIIVVLFAIGNGIINAFYPKGLHQFIYEVLQTPLKHLGTNIVSLVILAIVSNLLWVFGIHGPNTIAAIREGMFAEANLENLNFVAEHGTAWGAPYPVTWALNDAFANYGGSGMTLGLLIAIFIASRRKDYRDIGKLSIGPGLFNINEPVIFGLPVVLNPILIIPFILVPAVNIIIGYLAVVTGLIPPIAYAVPWTTPGPLIAFLGTGGNYVALLVGFICLAVSTLVYLPFVIAANRALEKSNSSNEKSNSEKLA
ncbi:PTS sugar transporter subunit IIC [Heyndrickxia oleronia]|jgi:PTS system cellobiose-specific IIC component|uniref:PTS sugar transporter subunit IIC n=1 Tax=Heyndrickxia oleronia TaxID=38875 RepID=UPI00242D01CE|nr:PTS sugar transporter subunit IIC [Heyndrickxia oleronia]MCI1589895.1 PTS sugar transporter subunit IIC [Heyndrickxia oleronia]MCI1611606.1 PTS sugar transporter subunit IIC [Heyndrickxia oleronia]MCI1743521.1 PTS sugar transporter subunit IIC [Heyndrickxia oleronia]MCI1760128.1 PTS sugar transporter subunit IIC [Heyndrickxia oleronia]